MEENKKIVEETKEQPIEQVEENKSEDKPRDEKGRFKPKVNYDESDVVKVNLSEPPPSKPEEQEVTKVDLTEKPKGEKPVETPAEETPVIEEVTDEIKEEVKNVVIEPEVKPEPVKQVLPENIEKLVNFMEETGGDINDYVQLNKDIKEMDDSDVLNEYYKSTKSHLNPEERNFLLEDTFGIDEEIDDKKAIRKKKIALKEQVAEARAYLDGQKSKYYEEIKAGSKLTKEQQDAIDFYNRHNKESEEQDKLFKANKETFLNKTENVFNKEFKGFDYQVGDKKFRFNVKDVDKIKSSQSDINNFVNKFTDRKNTMLEDAAGYHKSLFTAMNADKIASHFYEQGKADATKDRIAKDKNINLDPRQTHSEVNVGGVKVRALGQSSSEMKNRSFKIKKRN